MRGRHKHKDGRNANVWRGKRSEVCNFESRAKLSYLETRKPIVIVGENSIKFYKETINQFETFSIIIAEAWK
jgi:hypothetical protein